MSDYKIFIVDDDPWYGEILEYHLSLNPDYSITRFTDGKSCLDKLYLNPDFITVDYSLPDMTGDQLFTQIKGAQPNIPVVVISGQEDISVAVNLLKKGVYDYLLKDDNTKDLLWNTIIQSRETQKLRKEVEVLREELVQKYEFETVIKGQSPALKRVFALMEKAAKTVINVSVTGETGTGKELVAKAIHFNGDRRKKPFVAVNMAAIPSELVESELFGHEKGSFTGALTRKIGKFEEAEGGTLFLDEVSEMDLPTQTKLLRVLQERELVRVGGNEVVKLDVRIISATHRDMVAEVQAGRFREDLYYRILGLPIELPPLRERGQDILLLAKHFADEGAKVNKLGSIVISSEAKEKLLRYAFPGNIRELKAVIELAVVMSSDGEMKADDLTFSSARSEGSFANEEKTLRQYECDIIRYFLKKYDNDVLMVARKLDVGKSTIYKMIQNKEIII
jgi:two-component system, NtrC family, response regulator AtoC